LEDVEDRLEDSECPNSHIGEYEEETPRWVQHLAKAQSIGLRNLGYWHAPWGLPEVDRADLPGTLTLLHQSHISGLLL